MSHMCRLLIITICVTGVTIDACACAETTYTEASTSGMKSPPGYEGSALTKKSDIENGTTSY